MTRAWITRLGDPVGRILAEGEPGRGRLAGHAADRDQPQSDRRDRASTAGEVSSLAAETTLTVVAALAHEMWAQPSFSVRRGSILRMAFPQLAQSPTLPRSHDATARRRSAGRELS